MAKVGITERTKIHMQGQNFFGVFLEQSSTSVNFLIGTLMEEIKLPPTDLNDFEYRDKTTLIAFMGDFGLPKP